MKNIDKGCAPSARKSDRQKAVSRTATKHRRYHLRARKARAAEVAGEIRVSTRQQTHEKESNTKDPTASAATENSCSAKTVTQDAQWNGGSSRPSSLEEGKNSPAAKTKETADG